MMPIRRNAPRAAIAFVVSLAAAALVWNSGHRAGVRDAVPSPPLTPAPAINAFTDARTDRTAEEMRTSLARLQQQATDARTDSERRTVANALCDLGRAAHFRSIGDGTISEAAYQTARPLFARIGDRSSEASVLADLAETQLLLGQPDAAESSLRAALAIRDSDVGTPANRADLLFRLGDLLRLRGRYAEARRVLDQSLRLRQSAGDGPGQADTLSALGQAAFQEGSPGLARQLLVQAADLFARNGKIESRAAVLGQLGDVALSEGNTDEAERLYAEGLAVWQARKQGFWIGRFQTRRANLALYRGDTAQARALAEEGDRLLTQSNGPTARADALLILAEVLSKKGHHDEAMAHWQEAQRLYKRTGSAYGLSHCETLLAILRH